jgi:hypothetical protein
MAENLNAEHYRQALRLVLGELEDLDTAHPVDIGYRIGELKVHLRTLIGESGQPPMAGFRGLGVVTREVVDSADRWQAAESGVATVMVVGVDPGLQGSITGGIGGVQPPGGPLLQMGCG